MSTYSVRVAVGELKSFTERKIKEITLAVTANLVEDTPLDTGWARNNWVPRIGVPPEGVAGSRDAVSGAAQGAGLASVAATYALDKGSVFISNNVPYISALNDGHSKQAPSGYVQRSIEKGVREVV